MYFEVPKSFFKGLKHGLPKAILATPQIIDSGESIFDG
jgi:hypothetical protein